MKNIRAKDIEMVLKLVLKNASRNAELNNADVLRDVGCNANVNTFFVDVEIIHYVDGYPKPIEEHEKQKFYNTAEKFREALKRYTEELKIIDTFIDDFDCGHIILSISDNIQIV